VLAFSLHACAASTQATGAGGAAASTASTGSAGVGGSEDDGGLVVSDAATEEPPLSPDAACATAVEQAQATPLPVDIIWVVDNSGTMEPATAKTKLGLNAFAGLIDAKSPDYQVIMLSLRSATSPVMIGGSARYPVCIPPPLAGDNNCGDGPRFFHSSIDIMST